MFKGKPVSDQIIDWDAGVIAGNQLNCTRVGMLHAAGQANGEALAAGKGMAECKPVIRGNANHYQAPSVFHHLDCLMH